MLRKVLDQDDGGLPGDMRRQVAGKQKEAADGCEITADHPKPALEHTHCHLSLPSGNAGTEAFVPGFLAWIAPSAPGELGLPGAVCLLRAIDQTSAQGSWQHLPFCHGF
jgi:hypothetical protein